MFDQGPATSSTRLSLGGDVDCTFSAENHAQIRGQMRTRGTKSPEHVLRFRRSWKCGRLAESTAFNTHKVMNDNGRYLSQIVAEIG